MSIFPRLVVTSFSDQPRRNCTDPTDTAICCSLEPVDLNGIMWKGGSLNSSVFDLVAPVWWLPILWSKLGDGEGCFSPQDS